MFQWKKIVFLLGAADKKVAITMTYFQIFDFLMLLTIPGQKFFYQVSYKQK